jgi:hypothetical protein
VNATKIVTLPALSFLAHKGIHFVKTTLFVTFDVKNGIADEELDHFMELEHILRMAKARARQILSRVQ